MEFKIDYDLAEVIEKYFKIGKQENLLNTNNILKNKLKTKKIIDVINNIKNILENRLNVYFNNSIEKDKESLEQFRIDKDYNKINIMNVIIEEKTVML